MSRQKIQGYFRDQYGNTVPQGTITVYLAGSSTLADIYAAAAGGSPITGSYVTSDNNGFFYFWLDESSYAITQAFKIILAKTGIQTQQYDDMRLYRASTISSYISTSDFSSNNTILKADTLGTPIALVIGEQTILGRKTGGTVSALTAADVYTILGANLGYLAGLSGSTDTIPYFTSSTTMGLLSTSALAGNTASRRQTVLNSFRDVLGRPDFLYSGVQDFATLRDTGDAGCDSYTGSQYAYLAIDGNDATYWQSGTAYGSSSGIAFWMLKNLKRVPAAIKYLNGAANAAVTSVKVQYTIDPNPSAASTWVDIQTTTVLDTASTWNEFAITSFTPASTPFAIRLLANANPSGAAWQICTLILQHENILDVCTTGNAIAYDQNSASYSPDKAFANDNASSFYESSANMSTGNVYIGQNGLTSSVKAIRILRHASKTPKEVDIYYKDGSHTNLTSWTGGTKLCTVALDYTSASSWITIPLPAYSAANPHCLVLKTTTNCQASTITIYEMEFYTSIGSLNLTASATDKLHTTFGAGFSSSGATDYTGEVTASLSGVLTSPAAGRTHFVYQNRDSGTGALTYGSTPIVPQYGQAFDVNKHSLLHFDSSTLVDEFGHTWTAVGNGAYSATTPKFGAGKWAGTTGLCKNLTLAHNNGQPFALEVQWQATGFAGNQCIFGGNGTYSPQVYINSSSQFLMSLSSNNSSFDICSAVTSAAQSLSTSTWYKCIFEWDGYYYRVWHGTTTANMACVLCIKSSTGINTATAYGIELGGYCGGSNPLQGAVDEFRCTIGSNRYGWSPVAETSAFGKYDADIHFYDTTTHKMYKGADSSSWTEVQRVFLGEGYMDAQGFTLLTNYALQGRYTSDWFAVVASTTYTKNHNLGIRPIHSWTYYCKTIGSQYEHRNYEYWYNGTYTFGQYIKQATRLMEVIQTGQYVGYDAEANQSTGFCKRFNDRGW